MHEETTALNHPYTEQQTGYSAVEPNETSKLPAPVTAQKLGETSELHGLMLMVISSFFFSGMTCLVHVARTVFKFPHMPCVLMQTIVQLSLSITYVTTFLGWGSTIRTLRLRQKALLVFRGISGSACMIILFTVLGKLPLGVVTSVFYVVPVFTMILSYITMGETIAAKDGVAAILSFVGIWLISQPDMHADGQSATLLDHERLIWIALTLLSAFFGAAAYTTVRILGRDVHFIMSVCALSVANFFAAVIFGGIMSPGQILANIEGATLSALSGFMGFAGQCFMNRGLQNCKAGPGTLIRNTEIPLSYFLGIVFLQETVSMVCILGSILVLFSSVIIGMG